jgi:hypothetical protein
MARATPLLLGRRAWRRIEAAAVRGHEKDLLQRLRELAARPTDLLAADGVPAHGTLALQLPGRRLVLGGVSTAVADQVVRGTGPGRFGLTACGRYGRYWWLRLEGGEQLTVLATHVRLTDDPGRRWPTDEAAPVPGTARAELIRL